jgi:hypothetical protein
VSYCRLSEGFAYDWIARLISAKHTRLRSVSLYVIKSVARVRNNPCSTTGELPIFMGNGHTTAGGYVSAAVGTRGAGEACAVASVWTGRSDVGCFVSADLLVTVLALFDLGELGGSQLVGCDLVGLAAEAIRRTGLRLARVRRGVVLGGPSGRRYGKSLLRGAQPGRAGTIMGAKTEVPTGSTGSR